MRRTTPLLSFLLLLATPLYADRIHLRNGDYVDVDSWRADGDYIFYERFGGTIGIHKDEIVRVEQKVTDPTNWQAPGSSKTLTRPYSPEAPAIPSSPASAVAGPGASETWSPEPTPALPQPPARNASREILASYWERQKQFAMERMDYYANSKGICASRYRTKSAINACENGVQQSYRFWNERYIVASREYEKYR